MVFRIDDHRECHCRISWIAQAVGGIIQANMRVDNEDNELDVPLDRDSIDWPFTCNYAYSDLSDFKIVLVY